MLQPILRALVVEIFTLHLRISGPANESRVLIAAANGCSEPSLIIVVSSANCDKMCSTSPIFNFLNILILFKYEYIIEMEGHLVYNQYYIKHIRKKSTLGHRR